MAKKLTFVFISLICLLLSICPSSAQIAREDPDSLPVHSPYDADQQLAISLQQMFGSLDSFMEHINASDFTASRRDIAIFAASHANFTDLYRRSNLTGSDMEIIASKLEYMDDDLMAALNSSQSYREQLDQFKAGMSAGDTAAATQFAAGMQVSYRNVTDSIGAIGVNSTHILKMLDRSDVDTSSLEKGISGLDNFTQAISENNQQPASLLGHATLTIVASTSQVSSGDYILMSAIFRPDSGPLYGHFIRFYVDGSPAGSGTTDMSGICTLSWRVDGRSFNRTMLTKAEFDPQGDRLSPADSNVLEITRMPERALLQTHVSPRTAACPDSVTVFGSLESAASGMPAAYQTVNIFVAERNVGTATTGDDGTFSLPLAVGPYTPVGELNIRSGYECAPDSVLMSTDSTSAILFVSSGTSNVTLEQHEPEYYGGESALFNGTLMSGTGQPVSGANVSIFAGDTLIGTAATDGLGQYLLATIIPYGVTPGEQGLYAYFDPGENLALAGSRSETYTALFKPGMPQISVRGVPLIAFPGDGLNLSGIVMAGDGRPLCGMPLNINVPGIAVLNAMTDEGGSFQASGRVSGMGISFLSVGVQGDRLLSGEATGAGIMLIMPFDRAGMTALVIAILLIACMAIIRVATRRAGQTKKPLPKPSLSPSVARGKKPPAYTIQEELRKIGLAISEGGDRREAIMSIYRIARLMLRDREPSLSEATTHRELYHMLTEKQPSLSTPLGTITSSYEVAAFGRSQPSAEEVTDSMRSLKEMHGLLYGEGGPSS